MTRAERMKLAKAARELASEFAEGRGPKLNPYSFCGCAAGEVMRRAGIPNKHGHAADDMERSLFGAERPLTAATARQFSSYGARVPGAVVFPLLWLADKLVSHD